MRVVDGLLGETHARLALAPRSALNLVTRDAARRAGLVVRPAPALAVDGPRGAATLAEAADADVTVAGKRFPATLYVADWSVGADALLGAPTLWRNRLEPGA